MTIRHQNLTPASCVALAFPHEGGWGGGHYDIVADLLSRLTYNALSPVLALVLQRGE